MPNLEKARGTACGGSKVHLTRRAGQQKSDDGPGTGYLSARQKINREKHKCET